MANFVFDEYDSRPGHISLPMMSLREVVMFPRSIVPLFVGRDASIKAIESAISDYDKRIFLVTQRTPEKEHPEAGDLFEVGTVAKVLQMLKLPDGTIKVLFEGLYRGRWDAVRDEDALDDEFPIVGVDRIMETEVLDPEGEALVRATHEAMETFAKLNKKIAPETVTAITSVNKPGKLADTLMPHLKIGFDRKQRILELEDSVTRLEDAYELLLGRSKSSPWRRRSRTGSRPRWRRISGSTISTSSSRPSTRRWAARTIRRWKWTSSWSGSRRRSCPRRPWIGPCGS